MLDIYLEHRRKRQIPVRSADKDPVRAGKLPRIIEHTVAEFPRLDKSVTPYGILFCQRSHAFLRTAVYK